MAPKDPKAAAPAKAAKKGKKNRVIKNYFLADGVRRFAPGKLHQRRKMFQLKNVKSKKTVKPKVAITVVKKIGGAKNGGERTVLLKKNKRSMPTKRYVKKRPARSCFRNHKRNTRRTLRKGKVLILVAGRHKGKRVVLLKVLSSGLLLVTGPFEVNACPLRRISQNYVIATKTSVDLKSFEVPKHINDRYFRRVLEKKKKDPRVERDIFAKKEFKYVPSEQRKADQKEVDAAVLKAIKGHKEGPTVLRYLKSMFSLRSNQYPHRMRF
ncbi:60S ribosomal protein L6 [Anopheles darlingi]|uniref:Large ribosomal subunit protein eL6 n=1 Tax=Anopheles darlingi TaxID=43151 RepID=W5J4M6_ANODA|nr:60S ribosomal protein L6 [Anopheles darlingi]ETN58373.1 60S ribosomal protein L6 [Anopheles darlingi]